MLLETVTLDACTVLHEVRDVSSLSDSNLKVHPRGLVGDRGNQNLRGFDGVPDTEYLKRLGGSRQSPPFI